MRLIFNDLGSALSVKSCYSRLMSSTAVLFLVFLLCAAFLIDQNESKIFYEKTAALHLKEK